MKTTMPRLTFKEIVYKCPYCGKMEGTDYWSESIRKVITHFHYRCMIRRNNEILQHKAN